MPPTGNVRGALIALVLLASQAEAQPLSYGRELRRGSEPAIIDHLRFEARELYGRVEAGLYPEAGYHTSYLFALGLRPSLGRTELDMRFDYHLAGIGDAGASGGAVTLDLEHPIGGRARVDTEFRLDERARVMAFEGDVSWQVTERFRLSPRFRQRMTLEGDPLGPATHALGATRDFGARGLLRLEYESGLVERFALDYRLRF